MARFTRCQICNGPNPCDCIETLEALVGVEPIEAPKPSIYARTATIRCRLCGEQIASEEDLEKVCKANKDGHNLFLSDLARLMLLEGDNGNSRVD